MFSAFSPHLNNILFFSITATAGRLQETRSIRPLDFETDGVPSVGSPRAKVEFLSVLWSVCFHG